MSPSNQKYRVAILVALYRSGRFLVNKLKNLWQQTAFSSCQVVLLNCQNLDGECELYRNFADANDNVLVIDYPEYKRLYSTWNDGIIVTDTDYVMNSNADDLMNPLCIESLITILDHNPDYDVAHCDSYVTDRPNQEWPDWKYYGMIETIYPLGTAGPCPMWRRSLHQRFGLFRDFRTIGDARMWELWHANNVKFLHVPVPHCLYYQDVNHNLESRLDVNSGQSMRDMDLADDAAGLIK